MSNSCFMFSLLNCGGRTYRLSVWLCSVSMIFLESLHTMTRQHYIIYVHYVFHTFFFCLRRVFISNPQIDKCLYTGDRVSIRQGHRRYVEHTFVSVQDNATPSRTEVKPKQAHDHNKNFPDAAMHLTVRATHKRRFICNCKLCRIYGSHNLGGHP